MAYSEISGNWRHRPGKRPLHLWPAGDLASTARPLCGARLNVSATEKYPSDFPYKSPYACYACLSRGVVVRLGAKL